MGKRDKIVEIRDLLFNDSSYIIKDGIVLTRPDGWKMIKFDYKKVEKDVNETL